MLSIKNKEFENNIKPMVLNVSPNKILLSLKKALTREECKRLIEITREIGYNKDSYCEGFRNSERCIIDDTKFAKILEERIYDFIPKVYDNKSYYSINPRFRFLKYKKGGYFSRHQDVHYETDSTISTITILIYLNEKYEGGYTTFYSNPDDKCGYTLKPKTGMICMMDQTIGHEVPSLLNGVKYVARTELMYKKAEMESNDKNVDIKTINMR